MSTKSNNLSIFTIVAFLLLIGAVGYLLMSNSNLKSELSSTKQEMSNLEQANTELNQNYEAALNELEELRGDNQELNALIDSQKEELGRQKKRISGLIWSERELGKAREEIAQMSQMAQKYVAEVNQLKSTNKYLSDENSSLSSQNESLTQENAINKKRINNLDSVKTILASKTENLTKSNKQLSTKVDMAESIKINFLEVKGYDVRDDGSVKEKARAKKVEMLRTCFRTETNLVTPAGSKEFFIRYTSPSGEILYVEELGSGSLTNKLTGETERYTVSGEVTYNNEDMTACLDWSPNFKLIKGNYKIEMFQNGFNVGNGSFKLK
ncbi:MAG: hypothetical protein HKN51_16585 [Saprospiraceae bacterium]|nr:hypothetical protein [Bacteroidia bacterium]NNE16601.1 hypothetical protein [Saprospiraceae bacterium]